MGGWGRRRATFSREREKVAGEAGRMRASVAADAAAEAGAGFRRDGLFSTACATDFRRLGVRRRLRAPAGAGRLRG